MAAIQGAIEGWNNTSSLVPQRDIPYGGLNRRTQRYAIADSYYNNTIYDSLGAYSGFIKNEERLYKFVRGIENPVKQENDLIVSYTYKGTIDAQNLTKGSMPLVFDNKALEDPLKQVILWSNLDTQLAQYVKSAALYGDVGLWIVDDPYRQRVRIEVIDPARIKYVERDEVGNVKSAIIEYKCDEQPDVERYQPSRSGMRLLDTKTFIKTLKITKDYFETFKDGEPFGFYNDMNGNSVAKWPNPYGFVPLKLAVYAPGKDGWGQNSFFGTVRRQIDELNDQASIINDSIRLAVVPFLQAKNVRKGEDIQVVREDKDSMAIVYVSGENASIEPLVVPLDIASASANREALLKSLKKSMPSLALQDIRDIGGNLSGVAIQNMFGDATSSIENVRKNLNPALANALQMAVTIGGIQNYPGFEAFGAESFDAGDMDLSIKEYPVIDDKLSMSEKITFLSSVNTMSPPLQEIALRDMDYSEDDIESVVNWQEEQSRQAVRGFAQSVFGEDDDGDDTEEEDAQNQTDTRPSVDPRKATASNGETPIPVPA